MTAVRLFVEGFNTDDVDTMLAACDEETILVDDFAPHQWSGRGAAAAWYREMSGMAARYGMSDWSLALREPTSAVVSGDRAYFVAPVDCRWLQDGSPAARPGFMTMSLRADADRWRIASLAWTWS